MKLKKVFASVCAIALTFTFASCGGTKTEDSKKPTESKAETVSNKPDTDTPEDSVQETPPMLDEYVAGLPAEPFATSCDGSAKVTIENNKFMAGGREIWFNGVNTPWDKWNDFGGTFRLPYWQEHFEKLHNAGVNACRVWISCNGDVGMVISADGDFEGATIAHWEDLDSLFSLAEEYQIYIMATVQSFDHYKNTNSTYEAWRELIQSTEKTDAYIDNYIVPLVQRYDACDYLWAIDLCNEPDWIVENKDCGKLNWIDLEQYYAKACAAIHANSDVLVTVGMGMIKYNSDDLNGNVISDDELQSLSIGKYDSSLAYVDFWSTHWYEWMIPNWGVIYDKSPEEYKFDTSKPVVIGEIPAKGSDSYDLTSVYETAYNNGYLGVFAWKTSGGDDGCGLWQDCQPAIENMMTICPEKIFPNGQN